MEGRYANYLKWPNVISEATRIELFKKGNRNQYYCLATFFSEVQYIVSTVSYYIVI